MIEFIELLRVVLADIVLFLLCLAVFVGSFLKAERLERESIENGFAFYHPKTRKFTWHEDKCTCGEGVE